MQSRVPDPRSRLAEPYWHRSRSLSPEVARRVGTHTLPDFDLLQFVGEGWARWQRERPVWFDDAWIARVPPEFIPAEV